MPLADPLVNAPEVPAEPTNPFVGANVAARYASARPALHDAAVARLLQATGGAHRAIDLGCGTGLSTRALLEAADMVVGVDASDAMLGVVGPSSRAALVLAVAERLPFSDATFDLATVASAIHWFEAPGIAEIRRVLAAGGMLLVYDVWFPAEIAGEPRFGEWLSSISEKRYPAVAKHPNRDMATFGFESLWSDDIRRDVEMTAPQLVSYLMTHSERIEAIRTGRESEEEQARVLTDGIAPFYGSGRERSLVFGIRMELFRAT